MPRKVTVIERKLGREQADAQVDLDTNVIEIDPRLKPKKWLSRLCHEALHVAFPDMDEKRVRAAENKIAAILWQNGVRRVHLK
jgi:hypothetical protein